MSTALVVGLGTSGRAAAGLLRRLGFAVRGYDRIAPDGVPPEMDVFSGARIPSGALAGVSLVVLSPGVPPGPIREQIARHAPKAAITGELALGLDALPGTKTILVTGTNGKSTVTALTAHLLQAAGMDAFAGGNLGAPVAELSRQVLAGERETPEAVVLECSSFQLETFVGAETDVAALLPVTPDHLDRYDDAESYARTKAAIFRGATHKTLALMPPEDGLTKNLLPSDFPGTTLVVNTPDDPATIVTASGARFPRSLLPLAGAHNTQNARYAMEAASHLGATPEQIAAGLRTFEGLPHRMQFVAEKNGVTFYDDSKATNVASALAGLSGFERKFVLIAGGRAKGDDFRPLCQVVARAGLGLVTLGEAGPRLAALMGEVAPDIVVERAQTLERAVELAAGLAAPGQAVILSPACASYDMFESFVDRGRRFQAAVTALP